MVKRLPAMQETWVPSLGREDGRKGNGNPPLVLFQGKISSMEEPGGLQSQTDKHA